MRVTRLLVGMTGSVGVLNLPAYLLLLREKYPHMKLILTKSASHFIPKESFSLLVEGIYTDLFPIPSQKEQTHVGLAQWADIFIILPATAHSIAQAAHGLADTLLSATILSHSKPILFIPNMNQLMWNNPATQRNVSLLRDYGHIVASFVRQKSFAVSSGELKEELSMPPPDDIIRLIDTEMQKRGQKSGELHATVSS